MQKIKHKILGLAVALTLVVGLLPTVALAKDDATNNYTIAVGETIDLYGSFGLTDWESDDSAIVSLDGTDSYCPDSVTATGVALTAPGETVTVRRSYSVREGSVWSDERHEETFEVAVVENLADAPEGSVAILLGDSVTLNATFGFSDWGSEDSSIARLDGTATTDGHINISPDRTTVTGVAPGEVNAIRSYYTIENGVWTRQEEVFHITVAGQAAADASELDETPAADNSYTIQVGETIDLCGSFGLTDWESDDSAIVSLDGTDSYCPDTITATAVALTAPGETVAIRRSYSVRDGKSWANQREEEVFYIAVVEDLNDAPEGAIALQVGESITLNATFGFSDWGSEDSAIARLDGTTTTDGHINISPDRTTVTGVAPGTVNVVRSFFTIEDGVWTIQEEVFHITVVD
jgi:hypothetical protein